MPSSSSLIERLLKPIYEYFEEHPHIGKILLGLSGGPDSMALFHLLLKAKEKIPFEFGVAHIDHRWRKESASEAKFLKQLAKNEGIPFFLAVLEPTSMEGNLEEACRNSRYEFFRKIARKNGYQALFLAHHQGDQVETVLKRLFEGAHIHALQGMRRVAVHQGLEMFRPWLHIPKELILQFLMQHQIPYFEDATNRDERFLRGRMRQSILPFLEETFHKKIASNIAHFSLEAAELSAYMEEKMAPLYEKMLVGPFGTLLIQAPMHPFEARYLLKKWFKEKGEEISRQAIEEIVSLFESGKSNKFVETLHYKIAIDRGRVFVISKGSLFHHIDRWKQKRALALEGKPGWESVFRGEGYFNLPKKSVSFIPFEEIPQSKDKKKLAKKLAERAVPQFLRDLAPYAIDEEGNLYDPFSTSDFSALRRKNTLLKWER
jgi:tRNA(Ile)-lysidine synthase